MLAARLLRRAFAALLNPSTLPPSSLPFSILFPYVVSGCACEPYKRLQVSVRACSARLCLLSFLSLPLLPSHPFSLPIPPFSSPLLPPPSYSSPSFLLPFLSSCFDRWRLAAHPALTEVRTHACGACLSPLLLTVKQVTPAALPAFFPFGSARLRRVCTVCAKVGRAQRSPTLVRAAGSHLLSFFPPPLSFARSRVNAKIIARPRVNARARM